MPGFLDVVGRIMVEMGGETAQIEALGDRIVVKLPSLRAGASSLGRWTRGRRRRDSLRQIHDVLTTIGVTLEVFVRGSMVGLLGVDARAGLGSRVLGLGPLEIKLGGVLGSLRSRSDPPKVTGS